MEERLECIGNGELLQLWAERQMAAQTAGAQPAAAAGARGARADGPRAVPHPARNLESRSAT
jgi:hypothetical protein